MKKSIRSENSITIPIQSNVIALKERLVTLRKEHSLTQQQLADELNVSRSSVASWENGDRIPDINNLADLSAFYNVTCDYLIGLTDAKNKTIDFERF